MPQQLVAMVHLIEKQRIFHVNVFFYGNNFFFQCLKILFHYLHINRDLIIKTLLSHHHYTAYDIVHSSFLNEDKENHQNTDLGIKKKKKIQAFVHFS